MEFKDPLRVSTGDEADFVFVQIELPNERSEEDATGAKSLAVVKQVLIPPQMYNKDEADGVGESGEMIGDTMWTITLVIFILTVLLR